jgi:hypothetical protein
LAVISPQELYCSERWFVRLPTEQRHFRSREEDIYEFHHLPLTDVLGMLLYECTSNIRPQDEAKLTDLRCIGYFDGLSLIKNHYVLYINLQKITSNNVNDD